MNHTESLRPQFGRLQQRSIIIGAAGLLLCVVGAIIDTEQFFRSYLLGYIYVLGLALGSLGVMMLHNLVGGSWGYSIRRLLESSAKTLPLMAILFIPLIFGMHHLYEWTHEDLVKADAVLQHKSAYLNTPFFIARTAFYFVIWIGVAFLLVRKMRRQEEAGGVPDASHIQNFSAFGLLAFFLTATFASFDWVMSIEPHWFSTVYGMLFIVGQVLSTFAFCVIMLVYLTGHSADLARTIKVSYFHDLGNLLFAFTMFWAYISFSQYLIIYSANLPEEVTWYARRTEGGWGFVPIILLLFHFVAPFLLLLSRKTKRSGKMLGRVALVLLVMRLVDNLWLIAPSFVHEGAKPMFHFNWLDLAAPLGIGGVWFWYFLSNLKKETTLIPTNAPFLQEAADHG